MLSSMPSLLLLGVLLFNLKCCISQSANSSDNPLTNNCCAMRTVAGESVKSGTYNLKDGNDPRCPDGCLYSKDDLDVCFKPNVQYLASCDQLTTPLALTYIDYWRMDKTLFSPDTIAETGTWGPDEFCPEGAYATSFQLYVAPVCTSRCSKDDDVALMGMKLFCADYYAPDTTIKEISSSIMDPCVRRRGLTCEWNAIISCTGGQFTTQSRYLSEFFHDHETEDDGATFEEICPVGTICRNSTIAASDPMGGLNMDMECSDGKQLSGDGVMPEEIALIDGQVTTQWSQWTTCPAGYAICGIRSKVHQGEVDNAANLGQTEVLFHCCQLPPGFTG
eukprot:GFUD01005387.1.p1 GENE.GFUD01005387.1~~GFUD01005387.1.p1  ORF type:complete len:334 (+),score=32.88 GFUD01005387.1:44-1045(+)